MHGHGSNCHETKLNDWRSAKLDGRKAKPKRGFEQKLDVCFE